MNVLLTFTAAREDFIDELKSQLESNHHEIGSIKQELKNRNDKISEFEEERKTYENKIKNLNKKGEKGFQLKV